MSASDDHRQINALSSQLHPAAFLNELRDQTGARIQGWSAERVGGRSAETAPPIFDARDSQLQRDEAAYNKHLAGARRQLDEALKIQRKHLGPKAGWLNQQQARELAEAEHGDHGVECVNCHRIVECTPRDRLLSGRCRACHEYRRDHDSVERPKELWEPA